MKRKAKATSSTQPLGDVAELPDADDTEEPVLTRPDGFYWVASDGRQEFGPFETIELARADMGAADEYAPELAETLHEAEDEIGIANWIDPDTGEPAEGQAPPHLEMD